MSDIVFFGANGLEVVVQSCGVEQVFTSADIEIVIDAYSRPTAYERAVMANPPFTGTQQEFYDQLTTIMQGGGSGANVSASNGAKLVGNDVQLTLGDGTRQTLLA